MNIKIDDSVIMKASVIKRTNHSDFAKNFSGIVKNIIGNTADVLTSSGVRSVPIANLLAIKQIKDSRTGKNSSLFVEQ